MTVRKDPRERVIDSASNRIPYGRTSAAYTYYVTIETKNVRFTIYKSSATEHLLILAMC